MGLVASAIFISSTLSLADKEGGAAEWRKWRVGRTLEKPYAGGLDVDERKRRGSSAGGHGSWNCDRHARNSQRY